MDHASTSKAVPGSKTGTIKRKKVRSKSACDSSSTTSKSRSAGTAMKSPNAPGVQRQRQVSTANVVPGKRKRSSREKSVEPDAMLHTQSAVPSHSMITEEVYYILFYSILSIERPIFGRNRNLTGSMSLLSIYSLIYTFILIHCGRIKQKCYSRA